jgi:hypothetical protein
MKVTIDEFLNIVFGNYIITEDAEFEIVNSKINNNEEVPDKSDNLPVVVWD